MRYDLKAVNELVEQSKAGSSCEKVPLRAKVAQSSDSAPHNWQTMRTTHIHRPQYTTPGLAHLTTTTAKDTPQFSESSKIMPGIKETDLGFNQNGITNDRALYRHSDSKLNNIISKSVNRKNVSYAYHTGYPIMMNSQGPYAVYSHMKKQGEHAYQGERRTRAAAYNRFEDDLRNLQSERENQRD